MSFPPSDHCNGKTFFYPGERVERGWLDVLRWRATSRAARWAKGVDLAPRPPPPVPQGGEFIATWIGHATFLLQTPHGNLLTDPVFSDRASPVSWAGPRRSHAPGVAFAALPRIDVVLLSHDHFDHCDLPTLRRLAARHAPLVLAPLGHQALLAAAGISRVVDLDWWQSEVWNPGFAITLTPARHWCRRRIAGTNHRLWGGFFLQTKARKIYFTGDSGYDANLFSAIGRRLGAPDLALIPIGAYEPRWFMRSAHMNPAEAVQVHRDTGARRSVAMHWGTWQLTDEGRDDPPRALAEARAAAGLTIEEFRVVAPGESVVV
ncbi:MAG: MBL fold metallo-hydrolase [Opitutaceae bacterium]|nr:MBL fold metallo-hydrolase [Opitutaceae bacterium]